MGDIPKPILRLVACALVLAALAGFALGFIQADRKSVPGEEAPIAGNLPGNVVIKDAVPLATPPPPPPKPKAPAADETASDQPASDRAPAPPVEAPPPGPPPSLPGGPLPADLPPT